MSEYTVQKLADELQIDSSQVYRWVRGDYCLPVHKAIEITEIARSAGVSLSLEDLYETDILRVRVRMRSSLPPL